MGGEKQTQPTETGRPLGSPPHGRGKAPARCPLMCCTRITPAWAGKREPGVLMVWQFQDHPRVGGEKRVQEILRKLETGSPPRGRGKDSGTVHGCGQLRIAPAWAGKRCSIQSIHEPCWDHPRVGGEKPPTRASMPQESGSPPRGRGKEVADEGIGGIIRITPAWTGKSRPAAFRRWPEWDHPRMGGEKQTQPTETGRPLGSPPRGRGKVSDVAGADIARRITPAWAGKSSTAQPRSMKKWDHPRTGGEKLSLTLY